MKVSDLEALGYTRETKNEMEDFEIKAGYTGDLLSDVMANAPSDSILMLNDLGILVGYDIGMIF